MSVHVLIPTPLLTVTGDKDEVTADGSNIKEVLTHLEKQFPGIEERLFDDTGSLRRFVNIYVNGEDIRFLDGESSLTKDGDEVSIVPSIAGGK